MSSLYPSWKYTLVISDNRSYDRESCFRYRYKIRDLRGHSQTKRTKICNQQFRFIQSPCLPLSLSFSTLARRKIVRDTVASIVPYLLSHSKSRRQQRSHGKQNVFALTYTLTLFTKKHRKFNISFTHTTYMGPLDAKNYWQIPYAYRQKAENIFFVA